MANEVFFLIAFATLAFGVPMINPVNNAFANLRIADLFRITITDNNFTIFDYNTHKKINVYMDYKDKIIKDLLFCPRTIDNPLMGYFGRNLKKEHVMCKEILYQNIFTCETTNLRAECKSLRVSKEIPAKNDSTWKIFDKNFQVQTSTVVINEDKKNFKKASNEKDFCISESTLNTAIIVFTTCFLTIGAVAIIFLGFQVVKKMFQKCEIPQDNNLENLNNYCKTPPIQRTISARNGSPRKSISSEIMKFIL